MARLQPIEWVAVGFLFVLLTASWFGITLYRAFWVGELLLDAALWFAAIVLAVASVWWGWTDRSSRVSRWRLTLAMPIALLLAAGLWGPAMRAGSWTGARLQLWRDRATYEAIAARHSGRPVAFSYLAGIPDGGLTIVRWRDDPTHLDRATQEALTGERILGCRRLAVDYHLCGYD